MSEDDPLSNSLFREWLGTNYCPSNGQVAQIKDLLESPLERLAVIDTEVLDAQRALDALLTKQTKLRTQIQAHQALVHPIRRIPKEILQEIFLHCLPTTHLPVMSSAEAPILLTHVCHPWRALALSIPTLWSSIHIPIPRGRNQEEHLEVTNARLDCVVWWLALAKDTRLTISLFWPTSLRHAYDTERIFPRAVLSHAHHLRTLELGLHSETIFSLFGAVAPLDLPHLEKIVLRLPVSPGQHAPGFDTRRAKFWLAPKLTRVVWEGVDDEFLKLPLNWERLHEIEVGGGSMVPMSYFSSTDALALVKATPNIVKLSIELTHYTDSRVPEGFGSPKQSVNTSDNEERLPEPVDAPIVLAHLTRVDLTDVFFEPDMAPVFLHELQLPALRMLKYFLMGLSSHAPTTITHPLLRFLRAQGNPILITHLRIGATSISRDAFLESLRMLPMLTQLYVEDYRSLRNRRGSAEGDWRGEQDEEVAPDDDLLRSFVPASMWRRYQGKEERSGSPVLPFVAWDRHSLTRQAGPASEASGDGDVVMSEQEVGDDEGASQASSPPLHVPPPLSSPVPSSPPRISVSIPVDTSEFAAEESECLCPRLESLRFDRARFSLNGLRTFVKARLELPLNLDNDDSDQGSEPSSPPKSAFVSAPSSPFPGPMAHPTTPYHTSRPTTGTVSVVVPLQRIHVGLMSHRPTDDDADLESELNEMGVKTKINFMEQYSPWNPFPSETRPRNDARAGIVRAGELEDALGWGW